MLSNGGGSQRREGAGAGRYSVVIRAVSSRLREPWRSYLITACLDRAARHRKSGRLAASIQSVSSIAITGISFLPARAFLPDEK